MRPLRQKWRQKVEWKPSGPARAAGGRNSDFIRELQISAISAGILSLAFDTPRAPLGAADPSALTRKPPRCSCSSCREWMEKEWYRVVRFACNACSWCSLRLSLRQNLILHFSFSLSPSLSLISVSVLVLILVLVLVLVVVLVFILLL